MAKKKEKKENRRSNKRLKAMTIVLCSIALLPALALGALGVLTIIGVFPVLDTSSTRMYTVSFVFNDEVLQSYTYRRGDKVNITEFPTVFKPADSKFVYTYQGWDRTNDNVVDTFNFKIYSNVVAKPVFTSIVWSV